MSTISSRRTRIRLFSSYLLQIVALIIALFVFHGESFAQTGTLTDDAYYPQTNKYNPKTLLVDGTSSAYLKFELPPNLPINTPDSHIGKATLRLYVGNLTTSGTFNVYRVTSLWDETSTTPTPTYDGGTVWATGTVSRADTFVTVDLTTLVKKWLGDDGFGLNGFLNFGVALVSNGASAGFDSKEANTTSHMAQLDIVLNHAATADSAISFSGPLTGDVTGTQNSTVVSVVGGRSASAVAGATDAANGATAANTPGSIVKRDASGNFAAGTISGSLNGNAATVTNGVVTIGSYADPPWITSLAGSKIIGMPSDSALVHLTGAETITGSKTFNGFQTFTGSIGVGQHGPTATTLLNVGGNTGVIAGTFINNHNTSGNDALLAIHTGVGNAFHAQNTQVSGRAGFFETTHSNSSSPALETIGLGVGPAFKASNTGAGAAAIFVSGNVGIGTGSPTQKLDVVGNISATGMVSAASFNGSGAGLSGVTSTSLNCTGCIGNTQLGVNYAGSSSQGGAATIALSANEAGNALALGGVAPSGYAPATGSANYVSRAGAETITGAKNFTNTQFFSGNVGIGMVAPGTNQLLHVEANTGAVAGTFVNNHNTNGNDALYALHTGVGNAFHALNTQVSGRAGFFETGHPNSVSPALETLGHGPGPALKASNTGSGPAAVFTSGFVGIGTASPTQKLDVAGNISASGIVSAASFSGSGAGLSGVTSTSLNCAGCIGNTQLGIAYAGSSSQGGAATSALSANEAVNALSLGGVAPSGYAPATGSTTYVSRAGVETIIGQKTFNGFQTFTDSIGVGQHGPSATTLLNVGGNTGVVAGTFINNHNTSGNDALLAIHTGVGNAIHAQNTQVTGRAGFFETGHPNSSSPALETLGQGIGPAFKASNSSTGPAAIFTSGNVGIGTATPGATLEVGVGLTTLADAWTTRSSARLKRNVQSITTGLDQVLQLRGVTFTWKDTQLPSIGFIAEEVAQVLPEAVEFEKNGKDAKGIDYNKLTPLLVEAIKSQQKTLEELRQENARLQLRNAEQEARFNRLEQMINRMMNQRSATTRE